MKAIAAAHTPRVIVGDAFDAAFQQTRKDLATLQEQTQEIARPIMSTLARICEKVSAVLRDPRAQYELALHRLKDRAQERARCVGRFVLRARNRASAPLASRPLLTAQHRCAEERAARALVLLRESRDTQAHRHDRATEGVTCLRAPRAHLHRVAA